MKIKPNAKPLSRLPKDIKKGIANSLKAIAQEMTVGLKMEGPYYTGQFERAWRVDAPATNSIDAILEDQSEMRLDDQNNYRLYYDGDFMYGPNERPDNGYTKFVVPKQKGTWGWGGYVIGNLMEYRLGAMDIEPGPRDFVSDSRLTSDRYWYDRYFNDKVPGIMAKQVSIELNKALDSR